MHEPLTLPPTAAIEIHAAATAPQALGTLYAAHRSMPPAKQKPAVAIGCRWKPGPLPPCPLSPDAQMLQDALLDERTAPDYPRSLLARAFGAFWAWA